MSIKTTYTYLKNCGTSAGFENATNKRILLLNTFAIIWLHMALFFILFELLRAIFPVSLQDHYLPLATFKIDAVLAQFTTGLLMALIIYINSKHHFKIARNLFVVVTFINFEIHTIVIDPGRYIEFYFVFVSGIGLALFEKNTVPFIMMLLSFLFFLSPYFFYVVYPQEYIDRLLVPAALCIFVCIYLLINYFKKLNKSNEDLLQTEKEKVLVEKNNLEKKESELRELSEFKNHFFVNLSHEIRTPLTLINGYAHQISTEKTSTKVAEKIAIIQSQTNQMQVIINRIMDLSKMESNNFKFNFEPTDIIQLVTRVYNEFVSLFEQKHINVVFESKIHSCIVALDPDFISKSVSNLLSNALKFTDSKGTVTVRVTETDAAIKICVSDNGIGIPQQDIENIFKPFYQSKNHITKSQGSGIGLAFTKKIIEAHQFKISAKSNFEQGTDFAIFIPKKAVLKHPKKSTNIKHITPLERFGNNLDNNNIVVKKNKINILIVEDHIEMQGYLKSILENFNITQALNGKEALAILENNRFDLIITDFMMPIMDGESFVTEIKNRNIKTPIIVLTARTDNKGKLNMLRLGVDGFMHKPFLKEELHLQIDNALKLYHNINQFENDLDTNEKENLNAFAQKFNQELLDFINQNLNSHVLSVEYIANKFEISKSTLNRKIKALLGQTTKELILEARLQAARKLWDENPFESKKNIAQEVGMANTTYLFEKLESRFGRVYK